MSDYLSARTGVFLHAPHLKFPKTFISQDGGRRCFSVLIAAARDCGIIGPEDNGVVVIDEDNQNVVLANLCQQSTGFFGPSTQQVETAKYIVSLNWPEFIKFCVDCRTYRDYSIPDADQEAPDYRYPPDAHENRTIVTPAVMAADKRGGVEYPATGRTDIVDWLSRHHFHRARTSDNWYFAWDIKLHHFDVSGLLDGFDNDPAFNDQWASYLQSDPNIFWNACSDILFEFTHGLYSTYPGDDQGDYEFRVQGRSGGHLTLTKMKEFVDSELNWNSQLHFKEWALQLSDTCLLDFIRLVRHVDSTISAKNEMMTFQLAVERAAKEADWKNSLA